MSLQHIDSTPATEKAIVQIQPNSRLEIPVQYPPLMTELDGPQQTQKMLLGVGQTY